MPGAAIQTGCVDSVLPLDEIAPALVTWSPQPRRAIHEPDGEIPDSSSCWSTSAAAGLRLHRLQAHEPDAAASTSACRRVGVAGYVDYTDYLEVHPEEFGRALRHDPDQRHRLLPRPLGLGGAREPRSSPGSWRQAAGRPDPRLERRLRLGRGGVHPGHGPGRGAGPRRVPRRVKIYATDVDEEALARRARPPTRPKQVRTTSRRSSLAKYFDAEQRPLRLPQGPAPLGHLRPPRPDPGRADLAHRPAACRNTLMYFNTETQARILERLPLRPARARLPVPGQGRDAADPQRRPVQSRSTSSGGSSPRSRGRPPRPPAGDGADRRRGRRSTTPVAATSASARRPSTPARSRRSSSTSTAARRWPTSGPGSLFKLAATRPRPAVAGPADLLPAGRAALASTAPTRERATSSLEDVEWSRRRRRRQLLRDPASSR